MQTRTTGNLSVSLSGLAVDGWQEGDRPGDRDAGAGGVARSTGHPVAMATIALVGSGEYLEACRDVDEHLLGRLGTGERAPRVVCLPTASSTEGERVWRRWAAQGVEWFTGLGADAASADVVDRASADDEAHAELVAGADLVYLSGGKPTHLYETLAGTRVWTAIESVLARGGVLAGCSAGAMIQGERIAGLRSPGNATPGFGLLPHTIVLPHFDEYPSMVARVVQGLVGRGLTVVGVDGGTALVRHRPADGGPDELAAVGRGSVTIWGPDGHAVFADGPIPSTAIGPT